MLRSNCHTLRGTYAGSDEERVVVPHRIKQDAHDTTTEEDAGQERFNWHLIRMALLSPNIWFCSLAWFFLLVQLYVGSLSGTLCQELTTFRVFAIPTHDYQSSRLHCDHSTIVHGQYQRACSRVQQRLKITRFPPNAVAFILVLITSGFLTDSKLVALS